MAKQILTSLDLLSLPSLTTPKTGSVGFGAKSDGLYQKIGAVETKLSVDGHTHPIAQITGLQGALDSKATPSDISTAINATLPTNTKRDFINGTLITTSIDYSDWAGVPFYLEIKGNTYFRTGSCFTQAQGYIYNNTIVNYSVTHLGYNRIEGLVAINVNGSLCFWFPRQGYWEGYSIKVTTAYNYNINTITSITDVVKPAGTKEVNLSSNTKQAAFHNDNLSNFIDNIGVGSHISNKANPHAVTKAQVGLGNVDNVKQATKTEFDTHTANSTIHITSTERTNWNDANSKKHTHGNKSVIDALTQGHINVLNKLSLDEQGNVKVDATLWATGGISAFGLGDGSGSGGGGIDKLDSWANYTSDKADYYVPASLLIPFRSDTLSRLTSLENGSATSIVTTGSGNAITSLTKSGSVITADKGLTFALASHTHTIAQITGLQGALNLKATQSDIDTAINGIEIGGRNLLLNTKSERSSTYYMPAYFLTEKPIVGESYTLSGWFKLSEGKLKRIMAYNSGGSVELFKWTNNAWPYDEWFYFSRTFTWRTGSANDTYVNIYGGENDGLLSYAKLIKLEKGNKATDWTPAPEDQVSDWNETDVASFSYIKNKPTQLSQFTDNIGVGSHIANTSNPHNVTTAQIGAVDLTTNQTIGGVKTFTGNVTAPTFVGALSGNASSATKLQTPRTIAGVSFDGTANIAIPFANLASKPTTLSGYGITDFTSHNNVNPINPDNTTVNAIGYIPHGSVSLFGQDDGGLLNMAYSSTWQSQIFQDFRTGQIALRGKNNGTWTSWRTVWDSENLTNLNQLTTRNFSDLQNKPTTLNGYGITDGVNKSLTLTAGNGLTGGGTLEANRTFALGTPSTLTAASTNAVTSTSHTHAITTTTVGAANTIVATDASGGVRGNIIRIGANWTLELSGTELVFKYNGVIKQRMLSDGTILATGGVTALATS